MFKIATLLTCITICLFSCQKENKQIIESGEVLLKINILGIETNDPGTSLNATDENSSKRKEIVKTQSLQVAFDSTHILEATLSPRYNSQPISRSLKSKRYDIAKDTKYRIIIYDSKGDYIDQNVASVGSENNLSFQLEYSKTYTFILLSFNQTEQAPPAVGNENLSKQNLTINTNNDIMYAKVVKQIEIGHNILDVLFKHKSTEITTIIDGSAIGTISDVSNMFITPHYSVSGLHLENGNVTYVTRSELGAPVTFPTGTQTIKTSSPTIVASSANNNGTLTIGSITISGTTKTNLRIEGLQIQPGQRYKLHLTIKNPYELNDGLIWATGNLVYNESTQHYSFASQTESGSYFPSEKLLPGNISFFENNPNGDPCSKIPMENGKQWRTPIEAEFKELLVKPMVYTTLNVNGALYKGALYNGAVFFIYAGYYWYGLQDIYDEYGRLGCYMGTNYRYILFKENIVSVPLYGWHPEHLNSYDYKNSAPIRCVRDK